MVNHPDETDEAALNVLIADGLDLPTAWAASQRDSGPSDATVSDTKELDDHAELPATKKRSGGLPGIVLVLAGTAAFIWWLIG